MLIWARSEEKGRKWCLSERLQKPQGLNSSSDFYHWRHSKHAATEQKLSAALCTLKKERWVHHHKRHRGHRFSEARSFSAFMLLSDKHASFKKPPAVCICALQADGKRDALHRREQNICICTLDTLLRAGELNEPLSSLSICLSALNSAVPETFSLIWVGVEQHRCVWFVPQVHAFTFTTSPNDVCKLFYKW